MGGWGAGGVVRARGGAAGIPGAPSGPGNFAQGNFVSCVADRAAGDGYPDDRHACGAAAGEAAGRSRGAEGDPDGSRQGVYVWRLNETRVAAVDDVWGVRRAGRGGDDVDKQDDASAGSQ